MQLLQFKQNFHVEIVDSEQVVLFSEDNYFLLAGAIYAAIARILVHNPMSEEAITESLLSKFPLNCIKDAFNRLHTKEFLSIFCNKTPKNVSAFWCELNLNRKVNSKPSVAIKNFSSHCSSQLISALKSLAVNVENSDLGDFFIVIVNNYICDELVAFNELRLQDKKPWMLLKPSGRIIWIGPIINPINTGCWNCLTERLRENRRVEVDLFGLDNGNLNIPDLAYLPTTNAIAMNMAAVEVAKWEKSPHSYQLYKYLLTLDLKNMETRLHAFQALHSCIMCQPRHEQVNTLSSLQSSPKKYFFDEGERTCSLDDTFNNLSNAISPITGLISSIRHLIVNEEHVCYTVRTLPISSKYLSNERYIRMPDVATGKGRTKLQATVGCIAEAIERYNCTFTTQKEIRCSYDDIKNEVIHPCMLLNFSEMQYENREKINAERSGFNKIPKRYHSSKIGWTPIYSMSDNRAVYVPSSYLYLHYPYENDVEICPGNSNGCASGNSLEEAIFYALLELAERDAVAIWWYNRIKRPCININNLNFYDLNKLKNKFKKNDREFCVLDITNDLQIPSYVAISWKSDGSRIFFGTGSHLQPSVGIARAVSELNQVMTQENTNIHSKNLSSFEKDLVRWCSTETIDNHPYLMPEGTHDPKTLYAQSEDFLSDINLLTQIFKKMNLEVFLFDLTNKSVPFYTARVIIPGLRHFWSRLGPGRLYDVPVRLGWVKKPLMESEMNPIPYFL